MSGPEPDADTGAESDADTAPAAVRPVLRIVRGVPHGVDASVEIAAVTAVLGSLGGDLERAAPTPGAWNAPAALVRQSVTPGPDGWTRSARPR